MNRFAFLSLWIAALSMALAAPAYAGDPLNDQPNWRTALMDGAPTAVTVDVIDIASGTQVGDNLATAQLQLDAVDSIAFKFDLSTVTGYPVGCEPKTYLVVWNPDATNCAEGQSPNTCAYEEVQVGGSACLASQQPVSQDIVTTQNTASGQGISQKILDFYAQRGIRPVKWRKYTIAGDLDFSTPETTLYEVFFYTDANASPRIKCTVPTTSDPAVSLPSSTHCGSG